MSNLLRIDGMVDPHTHLRDLDWSYKATFYSETCAAVAGGYWAVFDMPNTPPNGVNEANLALKRERLTQQAVCDWGVYVGASQSDNTSEYVRVWQHSCGLKMFCNETTGDLLIADQVEREKHFAAWHFDRPIAVHAEGGTVLEILELVREYRRRVHFLHISTAEEIGYLRAAKEEGLPVTVGVCPHHLFLTQADETILGAYGLMKPTLKTSRDRDALWEALAIGLIDVVESDHAPHTRAEKQSDNPPFGVAGLETTLPLMLTAVSEGRLTLSQLLPILSSNVRRIWGLSCPSDTYCLVDLDVSYVIDNALLHTACGWSPFAGFRVFGRVVETWIRGVKVYDDGLVLGEKGFGQNCFV